MRPGDCFETGDFVDEKSGAGAGGGVESYRRRTPRSREIVRGNALLIFVNGPCYDRGITF